jgi:hypothetical protein
MAAGLREALRQPAIPPVMPPAQMVIIAPVIGQSARALPFTTCCTGR